MPRFSRTMGAITLGIMISGVWLTLSLRQPSTSKPVSPAQESASMPQTPETESAKKPLPSSPLTRRARPEIPIHPPQREQVYEEVKQNPHVTPPSVLAFAMEMAPKMEQALQSESKAQEFFKELEQCVLDEKHEGVRSTQALCLGNARRLSVKHPNLEPNYRSLLSHADPEVVKIQQYSRSAP